jgi:hypothetical protein
MKTHDLLKYFFLLCMGSLFITSCENSKLGDGVKLTDIQVGDGLKINLGAVDRVHAWPVPWDCTNYEFSYESSNPDVASVDAYGRVTAQDVGNATITVSEGSLKKDVAVEVYEITLFSRLQAVNGLVGFWEFSDATNFGKATVGKDLIPYRRTVDAELGTPSSEGITQVSGFNKRDKAIKIGHQSLLFCDHGLPATAGSELVKQYTLVFDINRPSGEGGYATLLNTSVTNSDDQDVAIKNAGNLGVGTSGYSSNTISRDTWYRVVVVLKGDEYFRIYVNGTKWLEGSNYSDDRFGLNPLGTLIMGDEDSDDHTMLLSSVAIFNRPLTAEEIASLGGL